MATQELEAARVAKGTPKQATYRDFVVSHVEIRTGPPPNFRSLSGARAGRPWVDVDAKSRNWDVDILGSVLRGCPALALAYAAPM